MIPTPTSLQTVKGITQFQPPGVDGNVPLAAVDFGFKSEALNLKWPSSLRVITIIIIIIQCYLYRVAQSVSGALYKKQYTTQNKDVRRSLIENKILKKG